MHILNQELSRKPNFNTNDSIVSDEERIIAMGTQLAVACVIYAGLLTIAVVPADTDLDSNSAF